MSASNLPGMKVRCLVQKKKEKETIIDSDNSEMVGLLRDTKGLRHRLQLWICETKDHGVKASNESPKTPFRLRKWPEPNYTKLH